MLPPKVPASKAQKDDELEKSSAKDSNPNTLADVITGSGIDIQREEEALLHSYHSQGSSTTSANGSFQWSQQRNHGAYQGTGPLSQAMTKEEQEEEFREKQANVAHILAEASSVPLTDPFLLAAGVRGRMSKKVYENGVKLDLDGLFDKIPNAVQSVTRREMSGSGGEAVVELQATSLLNNGAPLVDLVSLISLAAEERIRTVIEDAFALAQGRRNTANGVVPPNLVDLVAVNNGEAQPVEVSIPNISKTTWEASDSAVSPTARLPTPPNDIPPVKQATIQITHNPIVNSLKRKIAEDEKFEQARVAKRQKRQQGNAVTDASSAAPVPLLDPTVKPITKKERDRINKGNNTDEAVHKRANETAALALGGIGGKKKKYSWMEAGGSGAATPRGNTGAGSGVSGTATPAAPQIDAGLKVGRKREFQGGDLEKGKEGVQIQLRDLVHVLEQDGKERKALAQIISRMRSAETDAKKIEERPRPAPATPAAR